MTVKPGATMSAGSIYGPINHVFLCIPGQQWEQDTEDEERDYIPCSFPFRPDYIPPEIIPPQSTLETGAGGVVSQTKQRYPKSDCNREATHIDSKHLEITEQKTLLLNSTIKELDLEVFVDDGQQTNSLQRLTEYNAAKSLKRNREWPSSTTEEHGKLWTPQIISIINVESKHDFLVSVSCWGKNGL